MIRKIPRHQLDCDKYNACVSQTKGSIIYGFSWYLDIVCNKNWYAVVVGDYETVLPVPLKKKLGVEFINMPPFCQQLTSYGNPDPSLIELLFSNWRMINYSYPKKLKKVSAIRKNFVLHLQETDFQKHYRRDRKKDLKRAIKAELELKTNFEPTHFESYLERYGSKKQIPTAMSLMQALHKKGVGFQRNAYLNNNCIASAYFAKVHGRIYYLFSGQNRKGRNNGAATFLLDSVFKEYQNKDYVFDFEGSSIAPIADFFGSFGAEQATYYSYNGLAGKLIKLVKNRRINR